MVSVANSDTDTGCDTDSEANAETALTDPRLPGESDQIPAKKQDFGIGIGIAIAFGRRRAGYSLLRWVQK